MNSHYTQVIEERGLPANIDAEKLILGMLLIDSEICLSAVATLETADFMLDKHRVIYSAIAEMHSQGKAIDRVTVANYLHGKGQLEKVDGLTYLCSLDEGMPRLPSIDRYMAIVRDKAVLRKAIALHANAIERCMTESSEPAELLAQAEHAIRDLEGKISDDVEFLTPGEIITRAGHLSQYLERRRTDGVMFPWSELNELTRGMQPGSLNILAARTSRGKTAAALQIGAHAAPQHGVAVFSLEMDQMECNDRLLCIAGKISFRELRGEGTPKQLRDAANAAAALPIHIRDKNATVPAIHAKVRRLQARAGVGLVIVDYLQLLSGSGRFENRTQEVSAMSRGLKLAAADLRVPFLVLSQLSRAPGQQGNRRPELHDLRESGSIEQDANSVMFLHSKTEYIDVNPTIPVEVDLILAKQRNGPTGDVHLLFARDEGVFTSNYEWRAA